MKVMTSVNNPIARALPAHQKSHTLNVAIRLASRFLEMKHPSAMLPMTIL